MAKFLVTGGAGFIGSHLVEEIVQRKEEVRVFDNFSTGFKGNLSKFTDQIELIEGDLRDPESCARAVEGIRVIFHQAAIPAVPRSVADPFLTNAANIDGSLNLLIAARDAGVKRLVFAGSSAVYGDHDEIPQYEELLPRPLSPYAVQKLTLEHYNTVFSKIYGFETVSLRYFNVFGPRQDPFSDYSAVIPKFISLMLEGRNPTTFGDGKQSRDFTYVSNVVRGNFLAAETPLAKGAIFNCACGDRITLLELVSVLNKILGTSIQPIFAPPRPGDIKDSQAEISKIRENLGFMPVVSFEEGLARTVAWYRDKKG
ncbi:SDR family oxidoreductase [bacterium]|nr:SDR family oxidoreductase [bacterium]